MGPVPVGGPLTPAPFGPSLQHREVRGATPVGWEAAASWPEAGQGVGSPKQGTEVVHGMW